MSTAREIIQSAIQAEAPTYKVVAAAASAPENLGLGNVFVAVWRNQLTNESAIQLRHNLTIQVMVATTYAAVAENDADAALDTVLLAIERTPGAYWTSAERAVFDEKFVGYEVQAYIDSTNHYKQTILGE